MASGASTSGSAQVAAAWKTLKAGRPAEAIKLFDAALAQRGNPSTDRDANELMYAVLGRGEALQHLALEGRRSWDEEVEARRDFVERYGRLRSPESDDLVVKSMFQLAQALGRAGRAEESSAALDRLIDGFEDSTDESAKRLVWEARGLRAWENRRARQRARDRRVVVVTVYAAGGLALLSAMIAPASDNVTHLRRVVAPAGVVCLLAAQGRAAWRITRMRKRRGLASAMRVEYPPRHIAFALVATLIVATECLTVA